MILKKIAVMPAVKKYLKENTGDIAFKIINIYSKQNRPLKDEYLAEKLKMKVTDIRSGLNKLHYLGISFYTKEKNKKTGWYSFTWKINEKRLLELIELDFESKLEKLKIKDDESENYTLFGCGKKDCELIPFEVAAEYQFICPLCGGQMNVVDDKQRSADLKKEIKKLEAALKKINKFKDANTTKSRTQEKALIKIKKTRKKTLKPKKTEKKTLNKKKPFKKTEKKK